MGNAPKNEIRLLKVEELAIRTIRQFYIDCEDEKDRFSILSDLYKVMTVSKSIIFVHVCSFFYLQLLVEHLLRFEEVKIYFKGHLSYWLVSNKL